MKNSKDLICRRKHNRYKVKEGAFATIMSVSAGLGQLEEMSMGEIALAVLRLNP